MTSVLTARWPLLRPPGSFEVHLWMLVLTHILDVDLLEAYQEPSGRELATVLEVAPCRILFPEVKGWVKCTAPLGHPKNRILAGLVSAQCAAALLMLHGGVKKSKAKPLLAQLCIFPFSEGWLIQMFSYLLDNIRVHHL